jgi:hypothetical protein
MELERADDDRLTTEKGEPMKTKTLAIYAAVAIGGYLLGRSSSSLGLSGLGKRQPGNLGPYGNWLREMQGQVLPQWARGGGGGYGAPPWYGGGFGPLFDSEMSGMGTMLSPWSGIGPSAVEMETPQSISRLVDLVDAGTMIE